MQEIDLVIGNEEPRDATPEEEAYYDEKDYATEACNLMNIYATVIEIDLKLLNPTEQKRLEQMKRYCLRIAHRHVKQIYEENFLGDTTE